MVTSSSDAHDLAMRLAGASHSRRLYGVRGPIWQRTIDNLKREIDSQFENQKLPEVTFALLGDGLAVQGVPVVDPPSSVLRFIGELKTRDVEIISFKRGFSSAEIETLLEFLAADAADVSGVKAESWLRERGVNNIGIKHLRLMRGTGVESFRDVYRRGRRVLKNEFSRAAEKGKVNFGAIAELARTLMEVVFEADTPIATLLALRDRDDYAVVHSVNVSMFAGAQANMMGFEEDLISLIVSACLMHDIGKTRVPEEILTKRTNLSEKETSLMERHTVEGARILFETQDVGYLAPVVALTHHQLPELDRVGLLATEICKIADLFDGIRTARPFADEYGMHGAVAYMVRHLGNRLNPYLLDRFAAMVGLCREGDHAWLETGEIVRVITPHPELGLHPVVEVLNQRTGAEERGTQIDLALANSPLVPMVPTPFADLTPEEIDWLG